MPRGLQPIDRLLDVPVSRELRAGAMEIAGDVAEHGIPATEGQGSGKCRWPVEDGTIE